MAEDYSDLDEMVGNMKAKINGTSMKRMTPAFILMITFWSH